MNNLNCLWSFSTDRSCHYLNFLKKKNSKFEISAKFSLIRSLDSVVRMSSYLSIKEFFIWGNLGPVWELSLFKICLLSHYWILTDSLLSFSLLTKNTLHKFINFIFLGWIKDFIFKFKKVIEIRNWFINFINIRNWFINDQWWIIIFIDKKI